MAQLEMARAERFARSIGELVARIDRSSGRDHEKLVALLINHEMALRSSDRSVQANDPRKTKASSGRFGQDSAPVRSAKSARLETIRRAGLEADLASAQRYLGEAPVSLSPRHMVGVAESTVADRIRLFGRPFTFTGLTAGIDEPTPQTHLMITNRSWDEFWDYPRAQGIFIIGLLVGIALASPFLVRRPWINSLAFIMTLGLVGYAGGPLFLAGGLVLVFIGRRVAGG
jgi:hypothetical protein